MVGQISTARSCVQWLQEHEILNERYLSVRRTHWVYRLRISAGSVASEATFIPRWAGELPPDMYRVTEGSPLDALFRRLVEIGHAEVYLDACSDLIKTG